MIKLFNYRECFASNSSSTHSVWVNNGDEIESRLVDGGSFGWQNFVASGEDDILLYVAAQINSNLNYNLSNERRKEIIDSLLGREISEDFESYSSDNLYVDHQSQWFIPRMKDSDSPSPDYVRYIVDFLTSRNMVIVGGNDNDDHDIKDIVGKETAKHLQEWYLGDDIVIYDNAGNSTYCISDGSIWKSFDKKTGKKITFAFRDGVSIEDYSSSSEPELIDLIITNRCGQGCSYCYRNCSRKGKSSPIEDVKKYIRAIQGMDTFEVAIGGGDILEYPDFDSLIDFLKEQKEDKTKDLIFNTTIRCKEKYYGDMHCDYTKIDSYMTQKKKFGKLASVFSGIAVSVENENMAKDFIKFYQNIFSERGCSISFQIIPEILRIDSIEKILSLANSFHINVTFLGYKETGRGEYRYHLEEARKNRESKEFHDELLSLLKGVRNPYSKICIDTQFINNFPDFKEEIHSWSYRDTEGTHSCCIDAVDNILMKSSYDCTNSVPLSVESNNLKSDIIRGFRKFSRPKKTFIYKSEDGESIELESPVEAGKIIIVGNPSEQRTYKAYIDPSDNSIVLVRMMRVMKSSN